MSSSKQYRFLTFNLIFILVLFCAFYISPIYVYAQTSEEVICVGEGIADYANSVTSQLGSLQHVRLLTPVFNLTNEHFPLLANTFVANVDMSRFYAVAGNAYNIEGQGTITDYVARVRTTALGWRPVMLTEIGWYPHDAAHGPTPERLNMLRQEIDQFSVSANGIIGGLIFNVFGYSTDPRFFGQVMTPSEIQAVCGGDGCYNDRVGANSARFYTTDGFYADACAQNMMYTLEIANAGGLNGVLVAVERAHNCSTGTMYPIVRLGVMDSGGGFEDPSALASFIQNLDDNVSDIVYVVVGPNEPLTEHWATPDCIDSVSGGGEVTLSGYAPIHASRIITLGGDGDGSYRSPVECDPSDPSSCAQGEECRLTEGTYVCRAADTEGTYGEEDIRGFNYFDQVNFIDYSSPRARTVGGLAKLLTPAQNQDTHLHNNVDVKYVFRPLNMIDDPDEVDHSEDIVLCTPGAGVNDDGSGRTDTTVPGNLWGRFVSATRILQSGFDVPGSPYMLTRPRVSLSQAGETCVPAAVGPGPSVANQNISHNARDRTFYYHKISTNEDVSDVLYTLVDRLLQNCDPVCPPDCEPWCWLCGACEWFGFFLEFISGVQKEVKPLATGLLPAVKDTVSSTDRVFGSLMAPDVHDQLDSMWESAALNVPVNFEATFEEQGSGGGATDSQLIHSGGHANIRASECIGHCYLLTPDEAANISDEDRLCPSCNPNDYIVEAPERNPCTQEQQEAGLSPQDCVPNGCTWGGDGVDACKWGYACNPNAGYQVAGCPPDVAPGTPVINPGCEFGEGPVCEGCLDSPYSYVPGGFGFMDDCGGTGGPRDCTADCNRCKALYQTSWEEDTYSDSRFNGCYYANVNICVRNDIPADVSGPEDGICMYLCSDACCKYCDLY